jgi:hypothetical protein
VRARCARTQSVHLRHAHGVSAGRAHCWYWLTICWRRLGTRRKRMKWFMLSTAARDHTTSRSTHTLPPYSSGWSH